MVLQALLLTCYGIFGMWHVLAGYQIAHEPPLLVLGQLLILAYVYFHNRRKHP
jgi:hypothetical protein